MIFAKRIYLVKQYDGSVEYKTSIEYNTVTQLYTIGNHLVIVYQKDQNYQTDRHLITSLVRMEVEF